MCTFLGRNFHETFEYEFEIKLRHSAQEGPFLIILKYAFREFYPPPGQLCSSDALPFFFVIFFLEILTQMRRRNEGTENTAKKGAF